MVFITLPISRNFYPRPPRGGRRACVRGIFSLYLKYRLLPPPPRGGGPCCFVCFFFLILIFSPPPGGVGGHGFVLEGLL